MRASYKWLCALVPEIATTPDELAARLTQGGLEVEGIHEYGVQTDSILVAEVRSIEPHPSRAKLRLVTIDRGEGALQRVVCGAANVPEPGGLVVFAPLGTHLPAVGMTLTPRDIGGIVSEGMLCSETELGLSGPRKADEESGILILPKGTALPGTPLRKALPAAHDFIFEIGVTPNRPDALGHVGLAREISALYELPFRDPAPEAPRRVAQGEITKFVEVVIEDTERCPHYGAALIEGVEIGPSPAWLRYRLESLGIRSISNVVDITNLVLLEFGHPMHAFDLDRLRGKTIRVRPARDGEKLLTLDGVEHDLVSDDLCIADDEGAIALAGVMGGASSEITKTTKRVLLECAYFTPRGIRRASRRHALHTESSHRFERGVDPSRVPDVLAHAASLLTSLANGAAIPGSILAGVPLAVPKTIVLRRRKLAALLGVDIDLKTAASILGRLGAKLHAASEEQIVVQPPPHRPDLVREADLIEEVLRVRGVDTVPSTLPAIRPQKPRDTLVLNRRVRNAAVALGLSETISLSFVSKEALKAISAPPPAVTLLNPLGEERSVMRTSLLPGLFDALRRARNHGERDVYLFTLGSVFLSSGGPLPNEEPWFAAVLAGHRKATLSKPLEIDVYDAKGVAVELVERVTRKRAQVRAQAEGARFPHLHPRGAGELLVEGSVVGRFGPLHPDVVDAVDLGGTAVVIEISLKELKAFALESPKYAPIPALPAATRDIALVVHDDIPAGDVSETIKRVGGDICESVELFDLFRGKNLPENSRSLAFHVIYRDPNACVAPEKARTLTDDEVDKRHADVIAEVNLRFGALLRS